ncbi:MAG: riboflavin synthase [Tenacibaculum sp.]
MFTGIIEGLGFIADIEKQKQNSHLWIECSFVDELRIDQSVAHNGVCLTVDKIKDKLYRVTAIKETFDKTNIGNLKKGEQINLERCVRLGDRLDGHIVQGHVDNTGVCEKIEDAQGSKVFTFSYPADKNYLVVEKGSITLNGVSLTVVNSTKNRFNVALIPHTLKHTTFSKVKPGNKVNIEFDVIGKYVAKLNM